MERAKSVQEVAKQYRNRNVKCKINYKNAKWKTQFRLKGGPGK